LYEDECTLCGPEQGNAPDNDNDASGDASGARDGGELFCKEHQVPEHQCGVCQPQLAAGLSAGQSLLVRLPSARSAELAGLSMGRPSQVEAHSAATLLGELRYDGNRLARVTPLANGVIAAVHVDLGQVVRAGQLVATINSPAMAEAKGRYLMARHTEKLTASALQRKEKLQPDGIGSQRGLDEARAAYDGALVEASLARQGLLNLGLREREVAGLGDDATSALPLRAPFAGTVVSRSAVPGAAVNSGDALVEIADLSQMWVELSVPEEITPEIRVGSEVEVRVRTSREQPVLGTVSWVGPVVDERTRLVRARAVVPNTDGTLRQGMFADVTAILEDLPGAVRLPSSAVHRVSNLPFVFVQGDEEEDLFEARRVEVGDRLDDDHLVVTAGIGPSDAVVMDGGFTLKSALLASRLGAGCTDD
jgi:cobalt-zinc-cadmium efflux system membrane fusion protein